MRSGLSVGSSAIRAQSLEQCLAHGRPSVNILAGREGGREGEGSRVETEERRVGRERERGRNGTCMGTDMGQIHSCGQAFRNGWVRPPNTHTHTQMYPQIYIYTPTQPYTYADHTEPLSSTLFWPHTPPPPPPHPCSTLLPRQGETLLQVQSLSGAGNHQLFFKVSLVICSWISAHNGTVPGLRAGPLTFSQEVPPGPPHPSPGSAVAPSPSPDQYNLLS